jgi:hypothetical protein
VERHAGDAAKRHHVERPARAIWGVDNTSYGDGAIFAKARAAGRARFRADPDRRVRTAGA